VYNIRVISLPVLDNTQPHRPHYSQGPRSLASVKLLRISVTDRCNLRCVYCMPDDGVDWMAAQNDLLQPADIEAVARAAVSIGATSLKITGGEPTIRKDILDIAHRLNAIPGVDDLSFTTNGLLLDSLARPLREAGVDRVTLSCDSLRPDRYKEITHGGKIEQFWRGVEACERAGFHKIKLNVVVMAGMNDDEVVDFAALVKDKPWTIRFIEYMPLGDSVLTHAPDPDAAIVDNAQLMARIEDRFGKLLPVSPGHEAGVGPAHVYTYEGAAGRVGFISAMSKPFCESCNRLRLTALGELRSCLFDGGEVDLMPALRPKPNVNELISRFEECVVLKPDTHSQRGNRAMSQIGG